jgi:hypothetical protein
MDIHMNTHINPFNYDHGNRRKSRVSSRSSLREVQFEDQINFNQKHLAMKHEVASNYDDDDEKVDDELAEDLRKSGTPADD